MTTVSQERGHDAGESIDPRTDRKAPVSARTLILATLLMLASVSVLSAQQPADSAAAVYARSCARCHGSTGTPSPGMVRLMEVKDFADSTVMATVADSALSRAISEGTGGMPGYKDRLTADQITALVGYIRTLRRH